MLSNPIAVMIAAFMMAAIMFFILIRWNWDKNGNNLNYIDFIVCWSIALLIIIGIMAFLEFIIVLFLLAIFSIIITIAIFIASFNINKKYKKITYFALAISIILSFMLNMFFFNFNPTMIEDYINNPYVSDRYKQIMIQCSGEYVTAIESPNKKNNDEDIKPEDYFNLYMFDCIDKKNQNYLKYVSEEKENQTIQDNIKRINENILKNRRLDNRNKSSKAGSSESVDSSEAESTTATPYDNNDLNK